MNTGKNCIILLYYYNIMAYVLVYVPQEQITNNEFSINCDGISHILDKELTKLDNVKFADLQAISKKLNVSIRHMYTRSLMISEIQKILIFSLPENNDEYVVNN